MYLLEFIFLGLFLVSFLFLISKYATIVLNKVNNVKLGEESNEVLLILNYIFLCSYLCLKYYNHFNGLNYLITFSIIFVPSSLYLYKKYIYPFYDKKKFDAICDKDRKYILNLIKVNHPKVYVYSFIWIITVSFVLYEINLNVKVLTVLAGFLVTMVSNMLLNSTYSKYDLIIESISLNTFIKMKDYITYKNSFIDFFYCKNAFKEDFVALNFMINYYEKNNANEFIKNNLEFILNNLEFIEENNRFKLNKFMLNLKNSDIIKYSEDEIYGIINYLFEIVSLDKIKNKIIFLETQKIGLLDLSLFFLAKIEFLNKNYYAAEKFLKKMEKPNKYSINLEQEIEIIKTTINDIKFSFSLDRSDYFINENDYKRNSEKDKIFLKKYKMDLLMLFNNSCAKTKTMEEIELDHFFIPKNQGGSFILKDKQGRYVINAIPLNKKINSSKKDKKINEIFNNEELISIFSKLEELNNKINQKD